ncbi:MAG: PilT/PilU family type 4a pilus ATPase [Myxococcota bacterium]
MQLDTLITLAREHGASDLHLEGGLPAALRVRGSLKTVGEAIPAATLSAMARELVGEAHWGELRERRSLDLARTIQGVRCRINILHTLRGVGLAVRLLAATQASIKRLNLHPDMKRLVQPETGLVLVSGPTGSGKTSTLAALIQEINASESRHIITLEHPIEYAFRPQQAFIRQREVGRDTPSFEQGLLDALREDPDVIMVGEMRDPHTMRLTLNAAETGHLVLATMHSATCAEALQRVVSSFAPEVQPAVCAQLADCLVAVVCQRLRFRPKEKLRVPECEILVATTAAKAVIRQNQFFKLPSVMESGGADGHWTWARYAEWLDRRTDWSIPSSQANEPPEDTLREEPAEPAPPPPRRTEPRAPPPATPPPEGVIVINEEEDDLDALLRQIQKR